MRIRVEYCPEGGGDPKAIELNSNGQIRELTYEAMDEVLKADISEAELTAITRLLDDTNDGLFLHSIFRVDSQTPSHCCMRAAESQRSSPAERSVRHNGMLYWTYGAHWKI